MRDYAELIEALRCCSGRACCNACPYENDDEKCDSVQGRAADAIEELLAEREEIKEKWKGVMYIVELATDIIEKDKQNRIPFSARKKENAE